MKKIAIVLVIALAVFSSCKGDKEGKRGSGGVKPKSTGKLSELVVVMPENWWQDTAGTAFRHYFAGEYPGLPQKESRFRVVHIVPQAYNRLFKTHRNLVLVEEGETGLAYERNRFATDQMVMAIEAPDVMSLAELLNERGAEAAQVFTDSEISRLDRAHRGVKTSEGIEQLQAIGIDVTIPNDFRLNLVEDEFLWFFRDKREVTQGILIYVGEALPDVGMEQAVISLRDSMTLRVEGESEGAHMAVEKLYAPLMTATELDGRFSIETRGLWKMENDFMGGSFINYTVWDESKERTVSVDGFVYAPGKDKRNYVMELEAIIKSLRFADTD